MPPFSRDRLRAVPSDAVVRLRGANGALVSRESTRNTAAPAAGSPHSATRRRRCRARRASRTRSSSAMAACEGRATGTRRLTAGAQFGAALLRASCTREVLPFADPESRIHRLILTAPAPAAYRHLSSFREWPQTPDHLRRAISFAERFRSTAASRHRLATERVPASAHCASSASLVCHGIVNSHLLLRARRQGPG